MKKLTTLLLLLLGVALQSPAQHMTEKGVPLLQNFTPTDYNHRGKIWDIDSAPNGIIYMTADKGLLEFDGDQWKGFDGSDGITRSVLVASDTLIYTGSDLDFGFWKRNAFNNFEYTSLYPFKEDLNQISEEFWNVHTLNDNVFFVSSSNIYVYRDQNLTKIPAPKEIDNSFRINNTLYFVDKQEGLFELQNLSPVRLSSLGDNNSIEVTGMYAQGESLILVTQNSGLYQFSNGNLSSVRSKLSESLKAANVFSFETINDSYLAFGTILEGVYISDKNGNVAHHITKNKGLKNNTVLSVHYSEAGKLWLALDFGAAFIDLSNEFTFLYDYQGDFGTGYSAVLNNGEFYLGTNQGLYRSDWDDLSNSSELDVFELVPGTEGQVWTISKIDDQILMGHDRGLFSLNGGQPERIAEQRGVWTITQYGDYLLAGTYNGISVFRRDGEWWTFYKQMELILGSCNQIILDGDNTIWVNIPNYGVIKASLDENLYPQNREIFLSDQFSGRDHYLVKDEEGVNIVTEGYRHSYIPGQNSFRKSRLDEAESGIDNLLLRGSQPVQLNGSYEFYPVYNGFALRQLNRSDKNYGGTPELIFRHIEAYSNDERVDIPSGSKVNYRLNNLRIVSIVPNRSDVMYQYKTSDSDNWSEWTKNGTFELIGIGYGNHRLSARARVGGAVTSEKSVFFTIDTPWYLGWLAFLFYFLVVSSVFYLIYAWQGVSLSRQKKYLLMDQRDSLREQKERYRQQLQRVEEDKLRAEYDKMKAQLKSKTIELATKAKENDEKQKILQTLNEKFEKLKKNPDSLSRQSDEIKRIIDSHIDSEDNTFEIQIDELHQEFFETLRNKYSDLTRYDLRLCIYIKMGFDSKEIADLLNIKPSSVYISRSRLRKKLGLDSDEDLHAYLNSI
ncbi:helix-turn-helix and ligand-binding sensor domain-containing protein [Rhodohalobacter sp. 8-1]|uniref:helix-turn-helix and ligand-binding sensor domain-containing protein n=1 Tax=Rhodohalobacter sp. 8-1 TaxID=3131972 RepID=UPI0030EE061A